MNTLGIDCRFAGTASGLGRFTRELTLHLLKRDDPWETVLFVRSLDEPWLVSVPVSESNRIVRADIPHYSLAEQTRWPRILNASRIDLLLAPHFNVPLLCPVPFLCTIHDLILHRYPNQASRIKQAAYRLLLHRALARARAILTVSQFTARELIDLYGKTLLPRIATVYEGVTDEFFPRDDAEQARVRAAHGLAKPFFLYVGNAKEHKNVQGLIDAFHALHAADTELVLVTGGPEAEHLTLAADVRLLPAVPDSDLPALYSAARAFVTATRYEGFCLPLVEARACGCPAIAPRVAAIPEVADTGCVLVAPNDPDALTLALRHPPERTPPVRHWHWDETAGRTAAILRAHL